MANSCPIAVHMVPLVVTTQYAIRTQFGGEEGKGGGAGSGGGGGGGGGCGCGGGGSNNNTSGVMSEDILVECQGAQ